MILRAEYADSITKIYLNQRLIIFDPNKDALQCYLCCTFSESL
jgi:hypothetical protein